MSKLSRLSHVGGAKETTMGVAVAPTFFPPYTGSPDIEDINPEQRDESVRANDTLLQGVYPGALSSSISFGGRPHVDTFGHYLRAIIGPDTLGGGLNGLTGHTFKSNNTQPPSYTWTDFDTVEARAYPGCMLQELRISADTAGEAMYSVDWLGWQSAAASTPVPSSTTLQPLLGWQLGWSAGGVSSTRCVNTDIRVRREVEVIPGSDGSQTARETFAGPLEFSATSKLLFEDTTDRARFLTYAQAALVVSLTQPVASGAGLLQLTCSKASWNKAKLDRSGKYVTLDVEIDGIYNATDAGPVQAFLNSPNTGAY